MRRQCPCCCELTAASNILATESTGLFLARLTVLVNRGLTGLVWAAGAVLVLPLVSGGKAPAGEPALGVLLSLVLWGATLGALLPFVHRPLHKSIESESRRVSIGPTGSLPASTAKRRG